MRTMSACCLRASLKSAEGMGLSIPTPRQPQRVGQPVSIVGHGWVDGKWLNACGWVGKPVEEGGGLGQARLPSRGRAVDNGGRYRPVLKELLVAVQSSVNVESLGFVRDDSWEDRRRERASQYGRVAGGVCFMSASCDRTERG